MLKLFTDTDCDITPAIAKEYDMTLISMPYTIGDEVFFPYESWDEFDSHAFYDLLRAGNMPSTSAQGEDVYIKAFEPVLAAGDDILYVHFSAAMSATFSSMEKAKETLLAKYPGRRIERVDTKGISALSFLIVTDLAKEAKKGKTMDELLAWANTEVDRYGIYFFADDLKFFKRSGRVSGLAAMMGTLVGIRPIIYIGEDGKMTSIGTERGRYKAMMRLLNYYKDLCDQKETGRICIAHTDNQELVDEFIEALHEEIPEFKGEIEVHLVNPTIGSHCGPDALGIAFHCSHR